MRNVLQIWWKPENIKFVLPILGLSFTVLFDLGFFRYVGPSWFSLFSLSDHVLFALTAMPFVVIAILGFYSFTVGPWIIDNYVIPALWRVPTSTRLRPNFRFGILVAVLAIAGFEIYWFDWKVSAAGALLGLIGFLLYFGRHWPIFPIVAVVLSAIGAFSLGIGYAHLLVNSNTHPYSLREKDGTITHGILVIAGDRGVLFFEKLSKQTQFRRWESIDRVTRDP